MQLLQQWQQQRSETGSGGARSQLGMHCCMQCLRHLLEGHAALNNS